MACPVAAYSPVSGRISPTLMRSPSGMAMGIAPLSVAPSDPCVPVSGAGTLLPPQPASAPARSDAAMTARARLSHGFDRSDVSSAIDVIVPFLCARQAGAGKTYPSPRGK
jgi:hypothetical protein